MMGEKDKGGEKTESWTSWRGDGRTGSSRRNGGRMGEGWEC